MFDLRYHVASLAAVFVALAIGIFVGVGLSGRGFVSDAERENLQARIDELRVERDDAVALSEAAGRRGEAFADFADATYEELVGDYLEGARIGVLFVGSADQGLAGTIRRTVTDAGGRAPFLRALRVPLDEDGVDAALRSEADLRELVGPGNRERLGREVAHELTTAGPNPVLDALARVLVEEQSGAATLPLDGLVVGRPAPPQQGQTEQFLAGLYAGLAAARIPAVGVATGTQPSPVPVFRRRGMSTVDSIEGSSGRVALVYLLAGARPGSYGLGDVAVDGVLPAPPPRAPRAG